MTANIEQLRALAERMEKATGPDRELDSEILLALPTQWMLSRKQEFARNGSGWLGSKDYRVKSEAYTASVDAALALVDRLLPGAEYELTTMYGVARVSLPLNDSIFGPSYGNDETGSVPLAILHALVAALIAQAESTQ